MHYRLYRPDDFAQLYAIEEVCFQPPFRFGRRLMRSLVDSADGVTWIAEENTRMIGFAVAAWERLEGEIIGYIQTIEVIPEYRGRGVGSELLRHIEGSARTVGARLICLHVDAKNADAVRLYEAHGYQCVGQEEDYYGQGRAAFVYSKPLSSEKASAAT